MATQISVSVARRSLPELLARARYGRERFVIERRGQPLAAVLPYEEYVALADALDDLLDARLAREAMAELAAGETIPWEQVKSERAEAGE